ncbi:hypothetical protein DERF_007122 [Dermatophagoides farinae]|uniref:Uncharacterized protein n=1 Tax=Dermatophagoides farinae TaxID=6954 RepID=A0A922I0P5_DERFA|nr:hypothetical protein DERF_007122 [Dermatophagoides farinae]
MKRIENQLVIGESFNEVMSSFVEVIYNLYAGKQTSWGKTTAKTVLRNNESSIIISSTVHLGNVCECYQNLCTSQNLISV